MDDINAATALSVPCDACGSAIEGASIWYGLSKFHPWCWHAAEREAHRPGFDAAVRDIVRDELKRQPEPAHNLD